MGVYSRPHTSPTKGTASPNANSPSSAGPPIVHRNVPARMHLGSGLGFQGYGVWFRVSGFGFRVSGFGFWLSGFGFRG